MQASTPTHLFRKSNAFKQAMLWCLLVGFMLLQFLGAAHRYLHASEPSSYASLPLFAHDAPSKAHTNEVRTNEAHTNEPQPNSACQLFDAASAQLALTTSVAVLAALPLCHAVIWWAAHEVLPSFFWAFQARGPPALI